MRVPSRALLLAVASALLVSMAARLAAPKFHAFTSRRPRRRTRGILTPRAAPPCSRAALRRPPRGGRATAPASVRAGQPKSAESAVRSILNGRGWRAAMDTPDEKDAAKSIARTSQSQLHQTPQSQPQVQIRPNSMPKSSLSTTRCRILMNAYLRSIPKLLKPKAREETSLRSFERPELR